MEHLTETHEAAHSPADTSRPTIGLQASRHRATGQGIFPAIPETSPAASQYEPLALSEEAELYSFTVIHPSPKTGQPPFTLVYADFPEKARVFGRLDLPDGEKPRIGMMLRPVADAAGYVFIPASEKEP